LVIFLSFFDQELHQQLAGIDEEKKKRISYEANHLVAEGVFLAEHCALEAVVALLDWRFRLRRRAVEIQIHDRRHDLSPVSINNQQKQKS
jgi:hypothetical protein